MLGDQYFPAVDSAGYPTFQPERTWSWQLDADGTPSQPQPAQLPPGTYTVTWHGDYDYDAGQFNQQYLANTGDHLSVTFTITGSSPSSSPSATPS